MDKGKLDGTDKMPAGQGSTIWVDTGRERTHEDSTAHKAEEGTKQQKWTRNPCPLQEWTRMDKKRCTGQERSEQGRAKQHATGQEEKAQLRPVE